MNAQWTDALAAVKSHYDLLAIATDLRQQAEAYPEGTMGRDNLLVAAGCVAALAEMWGARHENCSWWVPVASDCRAKGTPYPYSLAWQPCYNHTPQTLPQALAEFLAGRVL